MKYTSPSTFLGLSLALLAGVSNAGDPASNLDVAVAQDYFNSALITPDIIPKFEPSGVFIVNYTTTVHTFDIGEDLERDDVNVDGDTIVFNLAGTRDQITTQGSPYNDTNHNYTILLFDADYPGANDTNQYYLHYLTNGAKVVDTPGSWLTLGNGTEVVPYGAPNPPAGSGPHRYVWLVFNQPGDFQAPQTPANGSGVALFNLGDYINNAKLGDPIAGTFFTVEAGERNVTIGTTTSVNPSTLPQFTQTSTSASASASASGGSNDGIRVTPSASLSILLATLLLVCATL